MSVEQRVCKECGKLFTPKGREKYCSDVHYRPCPVCGKPVIAKYLSDPPRRCEECKGKSTKIVPKAAVPEHHEFFNKQDPTQEVKELAVPSTNLKKGQSVLLTSGGEDIRTYVGPTIGKTLFQPNHDYAVEIERTFYGYTITATKDVTDDTLVDIVVPFSSMTSINQNFTKVNFN